MLQKGLSCWAKPQIFEPIVQFLDMEQNDYIEMRFKLTKLKCFNNVKRKYTGTF